MGVAPEADEMNCHGDYHQIDIHIAIDYFLMWFQHPKNPSTSRSSRIEVSNPIPRIGL